MPVGMDELSGQTDTSWKMKESLVFPIDAKKTLKFHFGYLN